MSLLPSIIRTLVPIIVGALITLLLKIGIKLDDGAITQLVTAVVTSLYYIIARFLEAKVNPSFGWLLGLTKTPVYSGTPPLIDPPVPTPPTPPTG